MLSGFARRAAAPTVPAKALILPTAEDFREELVAPEATADRLSETTMVITSSTWLARRSRVGSARVPPAIYKDPGEAPICATAETGPNKRSNGKKMQRLI